MYATVPTQAHRKHVDLFTVWPSAVVTDEKVIETCITNLHAFSTQVCEDFMFWELFSFNIIILHFNMSPSRHIYRPIIIILYDITEYYV